VAVSHSSHRSSVTDARVGRGDVTYLFIASRHTVPDMSSSATRIQLQVKQRPFGHHGHEMSEVNAAEPLPLIHADGYDDIHFHPRERPASSSQYTVCPFTCSHSFRFIRERAYLCVRDIQYTCLNHLGEYFAASCDLLPTSGTVTTVRPCPLDRRVYDSCPVTSRLSASERHGALL
jgi:hypothetical protein